jgi:hypothetical protein
MKVIYSLILLTILSSTTASSATGITGTYVAHAPSFTEMLQLTQTSGGQISGVLSSATLKQDGSISSEQTPVNGTADANQLTLNTRSILTFISGISLAGTISGNTIRLQLMDSKGNVSSEAFIRSSPDRFKAYADELKSRGQAMQYNGKLVGLTQQYRQTVNDAEHWITNEELHSTRIPNVKVDYDRIETAMRSLLQRERQTLDANTRVQIALQIQQGDLAGERLDMELDQIWNIGIGDPGAGLQNTFTRWDGNCWTDHELQKWGATPGAIAAWDGACQKVATERTKFEPIYKRVVGQRADLKSLVATARDHRKALVNEANRIQ